jgi:phage-related protein
MASIFDISNWVEYTYYSVDKIVLDNEVYYYCIENHTSSDSFVDDKLLYWAGLSTLNSKTKPYFRWEPSYGSQVVGQPRIKKIQFGDAYVQRAADGINNNLIVLDLSFNELKKDSARAICHFLHERCGKESFIFTPPEPYDKAKFFICESWTMPWNFYDNMSIRAQFVEVIT